MESIIVIDVVVGRENSAFIEPIKIVGCIMASRIIERS